MNRSESIAKLADALAKAQAKMSNASKTSTNPHFRSKYANLAEVIDESKIIHEFELSFVQTGKITDKGYVLETTLIHSSGEFISGDYPIDPSQQNNPQQLKSAHTYARRASLLAVLGMAEEDDDANEASRDLSKNTTKPVQKTVDKPSEKKIENFADKILISKEQANELYNLAISNGYTKEEINHIVYTETKLLRWSEMNQGQYNSIVEQVKANPKVTT